MGSYKKDGQYWGEREDVLMHILFSADTNTKEYNHAYREILPRLKHMAKNIMHRYFFVPEHKVEDMAMDVITHLLVNGEYDITRKAKMYSYCGTVIKNQLYDIIVIPLKYNTKINALLMADRNYDISDTENEWVLEKHATQPHDEFDTTEREDMLERILSHFDAFIAEVVSQQLQVANHPTVLLKRSEVLSRDMEWLQTAREYFNKYYLNGTVDSIGLAEYIRNNTKIPEYLQNVIARKYLGIGSEIFKFDKRKVVGDDKVKSYGLSYLMDDYTPNNYNYSRSKRTKKNIDRDYNYF